MPQHQVRLSAVRSHWSEQTHIRGSYGGAGWVQKSCEMLISTGPGLLVLSDVSVLLVSLLPYTEIFSFSTEVRRGCHCAY